MATKNHNIRFNMDKPDDVQAWEPAPLGKSGADVQITEQFRSSCDS